MSAHHGRDQIQTARPWRRPRTARSPASRSTCSPTWAPTCGLVDPGRADPRRVHVQRDLQVPGLPVRLHQRLHQQDAGPTPTAAPAGPRRRSPSSGSWTSSPSSSAWTRWSCASKNWIKHEEFPFTTVARADLRLAATTRRPPPRRWSCSATTSCAPSRQQRRDSRRPGPARASASRPSPRCAAWRRRGCSARCATAPAAGSTRRVRMLPTGKVEVVTGASPHGQGHETAWSQIVADRLGVPFEDVEVLHGDTQIVAQGPGHLRLALARRRRRSRSSRRPTR